MTQSIYQTLDDSRRLPWPEAMGKATIRARFMLAYADTDADTLPDAHAPRGTVTLVYAGSGYRWTDADGSRLVAALPVVCPILPDGTLGSPDYNLEGDDGVIIMPTEVAGLEPVGSTVTATIRISNAQATFAPITFTVKPDDDINLAELVSVQAMPGVVTVVDDTIAVRAEVAASRAEDAASEAGDALTQITAATDTVQTLSGTIAATADEVSLLQASAAGSASIAETAATEALTTLAGKVTGAGMSIRLDTSVGTRVFLDHPGGTTMLYGDTGWRVLSSWDSAGNVTGWPLASGSWEPTPGKAGGVYVRRTHDRLRIIVSGLTRTSTSNSRVFSNASVNHHPVGFRPQRYETLIGLISTTEFATLGLSRDGILTRRSGSLVGPNGDIEISAEVEARAVWPDSLPGVPGTP